MASDEVRVDLVELESFCAHIFESLGLEEKDAAIAASVLVAADTRGIPSHGVARLPRYVYGLEIGLMRVDAEPEVLRETASSIVVHAHGAMGAPVSVKTMASVIRKARDVGVAMGCVRDSNHFGIAGYYAMMALEEGMLGIAMTNTAALGVPTFGREPLFGTNPIAFAAPADAEGGFVLDMATTVVARGKIEVYNRQGKALPEGWAVDAQGQAATDAAEILHNLTNQMGGGILPLGGLGELFGGHKGYGLSVMVDILCGVLSGAAFGPDIADTPGSSARVGHFFGAVDVAAFRDPVAFRQDMDRLLHSLRTSAPAAGAERVYFAGLKEREHEEVCRAEGVPLARKVYDQLAIIGAAHAVAAPSVR
ncbi:MAG: Ldh family oxidoreductase [Anaerolineae bacterium]|nr:Ldh family oxidoreductase [Anaerolineae bacterium]